MRIWPALVLALLVPLSGCSGPGHPGQGAAGAAGRSGDGASTATGPAMMSLDLPASVPLAGQVAFDDSFPVTDTCNAVPARGCVERPHDLGAELPAGMPVEVAVDVTWPTGDGLFHMEGWVDGEGMTRLRVDNSTLEPGHWAWSALVIPGASSSVFVISGGPQSAAQATSSPYHVEVTYAVDNRTVPAFMPAAVALGPGGVLAATSPEGVPVSFLLYGPDDQLLQDVGGNLTLPADAAAGDYIVLTRGRAQLLVPGGGDLRFAGVTFTASDEVAIPSGSSATATVSSPAPPFLAGMYFSRGSQAPMMAGAQFQVTLTGPDGAELLTQPFCQPFCLGGFSNSWNTGFGKPLQPGDYTLTVTSQDAQNAYAGAYLASFDRSQL